MKENANNSFERFMTTVGSHNIVLVLVLMLMVLVFTMVNPNFVKSYNLLSMAQSFAPYAVLTLGVTFVIASGNTDLSLGAVCIASAVMAGKLYEMGMPLWGTIPLMILFGLFFGFVNGLLVAKLHIPSFIATLGTMMFVRGFSAILVVNPNIFYPSGIWYNRLFSNYNGFPTGILWVIGLMLVAIYLMYKNKVGRYILAIGSNREASRLSGIAVDKYTMLAYIISGLSAGIAGIFWSASFATVSASTGNGMEFDAIAAAFIGGSSASGGSASVTGAVLGMLMLIVIRSGLNFALSRFNVDVNSTYVTYAMTGIIIVTAIMMDMKKKDRQERREKRLEKHPVPKPAAIAILAGTLAVIIGLMFFTAGYFKNHSGNRDTIAVISKGESLAFWVSVKEGCMKAGEEFGYDVTFRGPAGTSPDYLPEARLQVQTALSNQPAAMAMVVICEGFTDILEQIYDNGIPVISFDSGIYPADTDALDAEGKNPIVGFVTTNNYEAAAIGAEKSFERVRDEIAATDGEYVVGLIQYEESETARMRINGFMETFAHLANEDSETAGKCRFEIEVKPDSTNNNYKTALEALYEKGARLIFMANLQIAEQVSDAIAASGSHYDNIRFCGFDCCTKEIEWMRRTTGPKLLGAVAQDTVAMGYQTVKNAIYAYEGREFDGDMSIDGIWYDSENIDELMEQGLVYGD